MASAPEVAGLVDLVEVGRGGFGVVYRALERDLERPVAVKVLYGQLDDAARRRFERERRAMGKISGHPHVVTVYRTGTTDDGQPFIVMEWMEGAVIHLVLLPADDSDYLVTASMQVTEPRDLLAGERLLSSLVVDRSAL